MLASISGSVELCRIISASIPQILRIFHRQCFLFWSDNTPQRSLDLRKSVAFNTRRETRAALPEMPRSSALVHRALWSQGHGSFGRRLFTAYALIGRQRTPPTKPIGFFGDGSELQDIGQIDAWVCATCGYTELWSNGYQHLMHNPKKGVHFVDATHPQAVRR